MDPNQQKESFSKAFFQAVVAVAECAVRKPSVDDDSVDWTLNKRLPRWPRIDVPLKGTAAVRSNGERFRF